jgi:hypothetical protein
MINTVGIYTITKWWSTISITIKRMYTTESDGVIAIKTPNHWIIVSCLHIHLSTLRTIENIK